MKDGMPPIDVAVKEMSCGHTPSNLTTDQEGRIFCWECSKEKKLRTYLGTAPDTEKELSCAECPETKRLMENETGLAAALKISQKKTRAYEKNLKTLVDRLWEATGLSEEERWGRDLETVIREKFEAVNKDPRLPVRNIEGRCNRCNAIMPKGAEVCTECDA
jgi:hypothetical protein